MANSATNLNVTNATDADFRAWGKAISDAIIAGGWVKTADTGQIDWLTVLKPTTTNDNRGYEIFRSNDAGGGLDEIYIKIEYGANGGLTIPGVWVTAGFGSNGSGALTGFVSDIAQFGSSAAAGASPCYFSAGAGYISIAMFNGVQSHSFLILLERTRDDLGAFQNEFLVVTRNAVGNAVPIHQTVNKATGAYAKEIASGNGWGLVNKTNAVSAGNIGLDVLFGQKGGLGNPSINIFGSTVPLMGAVGTTVTIDSYGETHNYILTNSSAVSGSLAVVRFE